MIRAFCSTLTNARAFYDFSLIRIKTYFDMCKIDKIKFERDKSFFPIYSLITIRSHCFTPILMRAFYVVDCQEHKNTIKEKKKKHSFV